MAGAHGAILVGDLREINPAAGFIHSNGTHEFRTVKGTKLAEIFSSQAALPMSINSIHKQAVVAIPKNGDLVYAATAQDNVCEALEHRKYKGFWLGIQGHAEHLYMENLGHPIGRVFETFVSECRV